MEMERLKQQMQFLLEIDKAKEIYRQTYISSGRRKENDAEHSWHLAVMAFVLAEYFKNVDILKVIKMVLMHDLVEIYAGDTYCYDSEANKDKAKRELEAAHKIYGMLPEAQAQEYKDLWLEFEEGKTEDALFAIALDHLQPITLNVATNGLAWKEHGIYSEQVIGRNQVILNGPEEIAAYFKELIQNAEDAGYLKVRKPD